MRVATKTISGLYDGATTRELDKLSIQTAAALIVEEPQYSRLAARLLADVHRQGGPRPGDPRFSQSIATRPRLGLVNERHRRVRGRATRASSTTPSTPTRDREFEYFGLRTVYDRYLLQPPADAPRDRDAAAVLPADRLRAVATASARRSSSTGCSRRSRTCPARRRCSTPARGTSSSRAASCSTRPTDQLESIYQRYTDVAMLSKFSGGIGLAYHRVRGRAAR